MVARVAWELVVLGVRGSLGGVCLHGVTGAAIWVLGRGVVGWDILVVLCQFGGLVVEYLVGWVNCQGRVP